MWFLAKVQYATFEVKNQLYLVLYLRSLIIFIVAGITSNRSVKGIPLTQREGAV